MRAVMTLLRDIAKAFGFTIAVLMATSLVWRVVAYGLIGIVGVIA
jgi:hypothetical protein